ncbi:ParB/RepB/Spo0J family partition protein [Streptomyces sp. TRM75561]|uniref:ParB/RepB/Spo0J family partition protein n=1 Tax=Streptomyces sp. TRM75561 TaxID=2975269 RepID=UPI0024493CC4|nr:ParB/RepB/Spo0J family partition protein [Streptomyces sp. TRM75561]MDH3038947.1 ParB/RepB/Spo0J family partition protein [Streptomyces sp. TRM75561]
MTPRKERITRGFSVEESASSPSPRRVRTRQQIMNGEGRRPPAAVALALLAHNPFNPREELTEIDETAESLRAKGQIQPLTVVRRTAFLTAHPGQEEALGEAEYVVIDGNRRLAAAALAGLEELRIDVNDDLAATAADIVESALIANIHRVDLPPMDQAKAIQDLVRIHGSQGTVARRLGKTPAWVSQRLALLELTPSLQEKVESGELKVEPARRIGRMPKEQQAEAAELAINAVKPPRQRGPKAEEGTAAGPSSASTVNGVNTLAPEAGGSGASPSTVNAVNTPRADVEAAAEASTGQPRKLPYDDPIYVVQHLHVKMTSADFTQGARAWLRILRDEHPEEYRALLLELSEEQQPV